MASQRIKATTAIGRARTKVKGINADFLTTLVLKPSTSQQADLDRLLAQQQNPSSPDYHGWLTPEQYADRFGVSQPDIDKIVAWLGQHTLTVKSVARGRNTIAFGGAAGQMETAFGVAIHHYLVDGVQHYANAADPTIPTAFQGVVLGIYALHDFRSEAHAAAQLAARAITRPKVICSLRTM
jgi:subtilase family serine protease